MKKSIYTWCLENNPSLIEEWDNEKNGDIKNSSFSYGSNKTVWWLCSKGHSFDLMISKRTGRGQKCPYCSGYRHSDDSKRLVANNEQLVKEWDYEKNTKDPKDVLLGSDYKAWWICDKGHSYPARVANRFHGKNCPYCAGKKAYKGYNDIFTISPNYKKEWDFEKNSINPSDITIGSHKKIWWKCECGNSYLKSPHERLRGIGCPVCAKRPGSSFPEQCILFYVKKIYKDATNRNTTLLGNKQELDIFIPAISTAIEYDGSAWHKEDKIESEKAKYEACKKRKIKLIRIREKTIKNIDDICDVCFVCENPKNFLALNNTIKELMKELNIIVDVDAERDKTNIQEQYLTVLKNNSLESVFPSISKEWNYERNGKLLPSMFDCKSGETVWWKCKKGHEWPAKILNRANGTNCPYCNNSKLLKGYNDLQTTNPLLIDEWDYEKNGELKPDMFMAGSSKKVWWKCKKGHSWPSRISHRANGHGCPECSRKMAVKNQEKIVECIETGICYQSISEAKKVTGINNISSCINGKRKTAGGFHWIFKNR